MHKHDFTPPPPTHTYRTLPYPTSYDKVLIYTLPRVQCGLPSTDALQTNKNRLFQ